MALLLVGEALFIDMFVALFILGIFDSRLLAIVLLGPDIALLHTDLPDEISGVLAMKRINTYSHICPNLLLAEWTP